MTGALELAGKLIGRALGLIFKTLNLNPINMFLKLGEQWGVWWDSLTKSIDENWSGEINAMSMGVVAPTPDNSFEGMRSFIKRMTGLDIGPFAGQVGVTAAKGGPLGSIGMTIILAVMLGGLVGPLVTEGFGNWIGQYGAKTSRPTLYDPQTMQSGYLRGFIEKEDVEDHLQRAGYTDKMIENFMALWSQIAPIQDVIRFVVKEVYNPERRKELLSIKPPPDAYKRAELLGMNSELVDDYWAGHWVLPSIGQLNEMLHRGTITPEIWNRFVQYNDYDPTMTDNLQKIIYSPLTRVDIRRIYDLRVIDEAQLLQGYKDVGYDEEKATTMTTWTKVYTEWPDLMARFKGGWIDEAEVKSSLIDLGMKEERATELIETKTKKDKEERTAGERDRTKAEIIKGVKLGKITDVEAEELMVEMGYDEDEATYIVEVGTETIPKLALDRNITRTDVLRSLNKGLIARTEATKMLMDLYYDEWEANFIIDAWYDPAPPEEEEVRQQKHLSKAEIIKGLKQDAITYDMALGQLIELGYEDWEAQYIIYINVKPPEASPQTKDDYRNMVASYKKAIGKEATKIPKAAAKMLLEINTTKKELEEAKKKINNDIEIQRLTEKLNDLENKYRKEREKK